MSSPLFDDIAIADWVKGVWRFKEGEKQEIYTSVGTGQWRGREVLTYETEQESFPSRSPTIIDIYEHVVDRPLLFRSVRFEEDEDGERTLTSDFRIIEYRLLPVASIPQIQVTPCVEDEESIYYAGTCLRF